MGIFKYQIINPAKDTKKPYYDDKKGILYITDIKTPYRYFVEAITANKEEGGNNYYIILGRNKFDNSCRICHTDGYGRCQVKVKGEIKDFIVNETNERGNININYIESTDDYDVFEVN